MTDHALDIRIANEILKSAVCSRALFSFFISFFSFWYVCLFGFGRFLAGAGWWGSILAPLMEGGSMGFWWCLCFCVFFFVG